MWCQGRLWEKGFESSEIWMKISDHREDRKTEMRTRRGKERGRERGKEGCILSGVHVTRGN